MNRFAETQYSSDKEPFKDIAVSAHLCKSKLFEVYTEAEIKEMFPSIEFTDHFYDPGGQDQQQVILSGYDFIAFLEDDLMLNAIKEFIVHRLVQDVTRIKQEKEYADNTIATCLYWIDAGFTGDPENVKDWPVLEPLVPHVLALLAHAEDQEENNSVISRLLNQLGVFYMTKAQFKEAEPLMRRALQIDEQSFGADHPKTQTVGGNYIILLQEMGKSDEEIKNILSNLSY